MNVVCEKCKNKFEVKIYTREMKDGLIQIYIKCSKCNTEYHSYYETKVTLKIQNEIDSINKELIKNISLKRRNNLLKQVKRLKNKKKIILESANKKGGVRNNER
ncbi:MAG: hypothetical protein ACFFG0_18855 [Candidatus Thorarchaeota archaeon]